MNGDTPDAGAPQDGRSTDSTDGQPRAKAPSAISLTEVDDGRLHLINLASALRVASERDVSVLTILEEMGVLIQKHRDI